MSDSSNLATSDAVLAANHADNMLAAVRRTAKATVFIAWIVGIWAELTVIGMIVVYDRESRADAAGFSSYASCLADEDTTVEACRKLFPG